MKKYLFLSIMIIAFSVLFCPISLNGNAVADTSYSFNDKTVTYNANYHTIRLSGTLPDGYSVTYENALGFNAGTYNASANIFDGDDNFVETLTATLLIEKADIEGITLESDTFVYDGEAKGIEVNTLTLFDQTTASVVYTGNGETEYQADPYSVTAVVDGGNNFNTLTLQSYYYIERADYDMRGITFTGEVVEFDGNTHSLAISGELPDGVSVSYLNNDKLHVGDYSVTAKFTTTNNNYNTPNDMRATLNITQKALTVKFLDEVITYNGEKQDVPTEVVGIVDGHDPIINYTYNKTPINAGDYTVTVACYNGDYYIQSGNYGSFTIHKATLTPPSHDEIDITYNPSVTLGDVALDSGFSFVDEDVVPTCNVNKYDAIYNIDSVNYEDCEVEITINVAKANYNVTFPTPTNITYGDSLSMSTLASDVDYGAFAWEKPTLIPNVTQNEFKCIFTPNDTINYNVENEILLVNVAPRLLTLEFAGYESVVYNGQEQKNVTAQIGNVLPMDENAVAVSLSYDGNVIYAKVYTVTAVINNSNYVLPTNHSVEYEILKADYQKPTIDDLIITKTYNAITISHTMPFKCRQLGGEWLSSMSVPSLKEMTSYGFEFYLIGNMNYNDSEVLSFTVITNCSVTTCNNAISNIGTVTLDSYSAISYAFECFNLVDSEEKAQCNLTALNSAKQTYNNLVNQNNERLDTVVNYSTSILNSVAKMFNIWFILAIIFPFVFRRVI